MKFHVRSAGAIWNESRLLKKMRPYLQSFFSCIEAAAAAEADKDLGVLDGAAVVVTVGVGVVAAWLTACV